MFLRVSTQLQYMASLKICRMRLSRCRICFWFGPPLFSGSVPHLLNVQNLPLSPIRHYLSFLSVLACSDGYEGDADHWQPLKGSFREMEREMEDEKKISVEKERKKRAQTSADRLGCRNEKGREKMRCRWVKGWYLTSLRHGLMRADESDRSTPSAKMEGPSTD